MALVLSEEQTMLKTSAREFLKEAAPVSALRKMRDERDEKGYDPSVWKTMATMGWTALTIPEAYGGLAFGYTGLGQILEETGRTLTASPLVSTILVSSTLLIKGASEIQKKQLLPQIMEGESIITLATEETNNHRPHIIEASYQKNEDTFVINGRKLGVIDGHIADYLIVSAKKDGVDGISLFLVDTTLEGISIERKIMMDSRNIATVYLKEVRIPHKNLIGEENTGNTLLEETLDIARIGLAAEMLGTMREAFDRTLAYLKERQQFGIAIGTFQALQHRAAHMYCEIENCKTIVLKALQAIDKNSPNIPKLASLAKAKLGETIRLVTNEAIQMYGGIGMTDDEEIGFFLKRARIAQQTFGDANYHLHRYAQMNGY